MLVRERAVITKNVRVALSTLDPAARLASPECLLIEGSPVGNRTKQIANVHKVKAVGRPGPVLGTVINLEFQVRGNPCGLNRREIGANDLGVWELVGKVAAW